MDELLTRRLPPAPLSCVPLHSAHLLQHAEEVGVAAVDSSLDEVFTAPHRPVELLDQFSLDTPVKEATSKA